jgi:hypothetical protein
VVVVEVLEVIMLVVVEDLEDIEIHIQQNHQGVEEVVRQV